MPTTFAYPTFDQAKPSALALFKILTGAQPRNVREALHHGWVVQGFLQNVLLKDGEPREDRLDAQAYTSAVSGTINRGVTMPNEQVVEMLGALANSTGKKPGEVQTAGLLDDIFGDEWYKEIAKTLLPVLLEWLRKWLQGQSVEEALAE